jgi:para-nitrobenzyl esterase
VKKFSTTQWFCKVFKALVMLSIYSILCSCSLASISNGLEVKISQSTADALTQFDTVSYLGKTSSTGDSLAFFGVPFAKAPIGDLRWAKPQRLEVSDLEHDKRPVDAKDFAAACLQGEHLADWYKNLIQSFSGDPSKFPDPEYSEDCLYLNIWAPLKSKPSSSKKRPVLVFIHGGSNKGGWSYEPNYIGEQFASRDAVVVSIAYRLGAFGYFSHPGLDQANFGLLDQIEALRWVVRNIANVGGDPSNITVAGESSGAHNIIQLLASPLATNLFQRAVVQSGGWAMYGTATKKSAEHTGLALVSSLIDDQHVEENSDDITKLRKLSASAILEKANEVYQGLSFAPVIDGDSVIQTMQQAVNAGELAKIDLIIGSNANEGLMYVDPSNTLEKWLSSNAPETKLSDIKKYLSSDGSLRNHLDELSTAFDFTCPSLMLAEAMSERGGRSWVYQFTKTRDGELGDAMGAYHGAELPYVFNTHDDWLPTSQTDQMLTQSIMTYWASFTQYGDPNGGSEATWPLFKGQGSSVQILGSRIYSQPHPSEALCAALAN